MDVLNDFCFGIEFFRYPGPPLEELKKDLRLFRENGLNVVRLQTNWAYEEPLEEQYQFSKIEQILDYAQELGMEALVTICLENAPTWLFAQYDVYQEDATGAKVRHSLPYPIPGDGKPGPCFDNPVAVEKAERYASALVRCLSAHSNVIGWAVWQEARSVGGIPLTPNQALCWCEHTRQAFIRWLQEKYATLAEVNAALLTNYGDWQHILPPYLLYVNMKQSPLYMEYAHFLCERMGKIAEWKKKLVQANDPQKRPVMCHTVLAMAEAGLENQWANEYIIAKEMDCFGISSYPKWGTGPYEDNEDILALMQPLNAARCANYGKPVWVEELQFGRPGSILERSVEPTARDLQNWILTSLASNAKGIIGWSYRDESFCLESFSHGILDQSGKPHKWFSAVTEIAPFLERNRKVLAGAQLVPDKTAIILNADNYLLGHMADKEYLAVNAGKELYKSLVRLGIFPDYIWKEQLSAQRLSQYDHVFLPFPLSVDKDTAKLLRDYVAAGGHLISEACPASYTALSCAEKHSLANGLDQLFGCTEDNVCEIQDPAVCGGIADEQGRWVESVHFIQTYTCQTGKPFLWCKESPAGVRNAYGNGTAELVGTFFGGKAQNQWLIAEMLGVTQPPELWMRELDSEACKVLVFYNPHHEEKTMPLPQGTIVDQFHGDVTVENGVASVSVPAKSSACLIMKHEDR